MLALFDKLNKSGRLCHAKENEIILYTDFEPNGMKIGDGKTKVGDLPFVNNAEYFVEEDTLVINTKGGL